MNDAWMVRGSERQELLNQLKQSVCELDQEQSEIGRHDVEYAVAKACLEFLQDETAKQSGGLGSVFFYETALPLISAFARAKEERDALIGTFLVWLIDSINNRFQGDLQQKGIVDPQTIFHAPSAMAPI